MNALKLSRRPKERHQEAMTQSIPELPLAFCPERELLLLGKSAGQVALCDAVRV
jgi:hypothetical protein